MFFTLLAVWPQSINVLFLHCRRLVALWPQFFCLLCSLLTLLAVWPQSFLLYFFFNLAAIWRICFFSFIAFLCLLSWPFKPSNSRFHCKGLVAWASVLHSFTFLLLFAVWPMWFFMSWHFFRHITDSWSLAHKFEIEIFFAMRKLILCLCRGQENWLLWTSILFSIGVVALSSQIFCFCLLNILTLQPLFYLRPVLRRLNFYDDWFLSVTLMFKIHFLIFFDRCCGLCVFLILADNLSLCPCSSVITSNFFVACLTNSVVSFVSFFLVLEDAWLNGHS